MFPQSVVAALALLILVAADGTATAMAADVSSDATAVPEGERRYAMRTTVDRLGRVMAPVAVDGSEPLRFILDTGANRSAVSASTAARLGLVPDDSAPVQVHGITGSAVLPTVWVDQMRAGELVLQGRRLPVLPEAVFAGADGILGIDSLQDARIEVDFESDRVTITQSRSRRAAPGYLVIPAHIRHGGLLFVKARVGRIRVKAVLDTGAERSLGNEALRDSLVLRTKKLGEETRSTVIGATPQLASGTSFKAPSIFMGGARLDDLVVTFGDLHVFDIWSLDQEPAMIIGMDLLGTLRQFVVDYPRREFHLKP